MDWAQVLAIVLPVMLAIIIGVFYNNRRFDDVNHRFDDLRSEMNEKFVNLNEKLKEIKGLLMEFLKKKAGV
jgi:hypothetical protein